MLLVFSLAAAVVYPSFGPLLSRTQLEASARRSASFLDDVRRRAVLGGAALSVTLDGKEGGRLLARREGEEKPVAELPLALTEGEASLEPEEVLYHPQGHSSGGSLSFRRNGEEVFRVRVGSFTGLARLEERGEPLGERRP